MPSEIITQLGVGGLTAYVVLKETFSFLKAYRFRNGQNGNGNGSKEYQAMARDIATLKANQEGMVNLLDKGVIPRIQNLERMSRGRGDD